MHDRLRFEMPVVTAYVVDYYGLRSVSIIESFPLIMHR